MSKVIKVARPVASEAQRIIGWRYDEWKEQEMLTWCKKHCKKRYEFTSRDGLYDRTIGPDYGTMLQPAVLVFLFEDENEADKFAAMWCEGND